MMRVGLACAFALVITVPVSAQDPAVTTPALHVPVGFSVETIAHVRGARELTVAPNGDLFVGTNGDTVELVPSAQGEPGAPVIFTHVDDPPAAGVTLAGGTLYIGAQFNVYAVPYRIGDRSAAVAPRKIAALRVSGEARDHHTTTVAIAGASLYASVGSSCNNCQPELDATRATILQMHLDGEHVQPRAVHIRNAIALAVNPQTQALWAGVAGQDELAHGHPYEMVDDVTAHAGTSDYGWPYCFENQQSVGDHDCSHAVASRVVVPAYETPIGAVFYPDGHAHRYAFPAAYHGALFVALHGSWHTPPVPPRVVFIPMHGDEPQTPVDWDDPTRQWHDFLTGFQRPDGSRSGRPTGIAVGTDGSLFVADDDAGLIYRIRPNLRK